VILKIEERNFDLGPRKTTKRPSNRPLNIFLQQGIFLLNAIPVWRSSCDVYIREKKKRIKS